MRRLPTLILSTVSLSALLASAANAQVASPVEAQPSVDRDQPPAQKGQQKTNARGQAINGDEIVVTGSRVRRSTYNTPSPVDVITRDDTVLAGSRSTAEVLQSSTVTSGTAQINNTFLGYVSEGGPGANTVGLRGLGSSRTLVMLNGRRLAPAGAGPQLIAADLNVLPTNIVQRIEVLREGASSVYGSDAIAGVINIITDTKINGLTVDAYTNQPIDSTGGGRSYRLSAIAGKTFERGHIIGSVEYRETTGLRVGDRKDFSCPRDLFYNAAGQEVGQLDPATGKPRCFPFQYDGIGTAQNYLLGYGFTRGVSRFTYVDGDINNLQTVNNFNLRPLASPTQLKDHVYSPLKTLTGYVNGSYELGMLGDAEIYGEGLFTRRKSHQDYSAQISIDPNQLGSEIYGGTYDGTPISEYGYPTSPFFPVSAANQNFNVLRVFIVPNRPLQTRQKVDFYRGNAGLRGNLGIGDWKYDGNFQYSHTKAVYDVQNIDTRRFRNSLSTVLAPAGTPDSLVTVALPGQEGAGGRYTCASNLNSSGALIAGANCVPINIFDPQVLLGNIPDNVFNYLYSRNVGVTKFDQSTAQLVVDGTLINLPAGPVRVALGAEHRNDKISDVPSDAAQTGNLYNYSSAGITKGKDRVDELFGEINIPILRRKPFFYELSAEGSARYTHYKSYGSGTTYHVGAQWAPVKVLRFRGNYGTSFRAPNLYEQFVADQSGFYGPGSDPCNDFGQRYGKTDPAYVNCLAQLQTTGANLGPDPANPNFVATGGPQVFTRGGAGNLKAEHSTSWGLGAIVDANVGSAQFSLAADYFNIRVRDEVNLLNTVILSRCYESTNFGPSNPYCALIAPREQAQGNLTSFLNPYLNVASQKVDGIDFSGRFSTGLWGGKFVADLRATRTLHQKFQQLAEEDPFDYNGTLGNAGAPGGPKWVGDLDLRYTMRGGKITFRYGVNYIGPMDSNGLVNPITINGAPATFDLHAEHYYKHDASIQWKWPTVGQVTLGVTNLFNRKPATISGFPTSDGQYPRIGNYFNYSGYDFLGRSIFMNVTRSF